MSVSLRDSSDGILSGVEILPDMPMCRYRFLDFDLEPPERSTRHNNFPFLSTSSTAHFFTKSNSDSEGKIFGVVGDGVSTVKRDGEELFVSLFRDKSN